MTVMRGRRLVPERTDQGRTRRADERPENCVGPNNARGDRYQSTGERSWPQVMAMIVSTTLGSWVHTLRAIALMVTPLVIVLISMAFGVQINIGDLHIGTTP